MFLLVKSLDRLGISGRERRRAVLAQRAGQRQEAHLTRGLGPQAKQRALRQAGNDGEDGAGLLLAVVLYLCCNLDASPASAVQDGEALRGGRSAFCVLTVIRPDATGAPEDTLQVEVPSTASTLEVKNQISELYGIPMESQRLQCTPDPEDECLGDDCAICDIVGDGEAAMPLFLVLTEAAEETVSAPRHSQPRAWEERLIHVEYDLRVVRPEDAGGIAAGKAVQLRLSALTPAIEAQAAAEAALLDSVGQEPAFLSFAGRVIPPDLPIHFAGVGDGDTLVLLAHAVPVIPQDFDPGAQADNDSDSDSFDASILKARRRDAKMGLSRGVLSLYPESVSVGVNHHPCALGAQEPPEDFLESEWQHVPGCLGRCFVGCWRDGGRPPLDSASVIGDSPRCASRIVMG
ncbi:hypothetical protein AK812_SmicGene13086 [Symbiodinium microadriaticum]|uniref:Uncharacterized protein n=1 Tax=Symbiodinium microadriaticum TaxID=2951 RepID=A0A1Q9E909_SYMMI|nr:hypothetical protein AK812_SmicGene13086 [Symbiodinium microadriaticum]